MATLVLQISRLPVILIWTMYFHGLLIGLDASFTCKAGQRVAKDATRCEQCPDGDYQHTENESMQCKVCTKCGKGSEVESPCTNTKNTKCRCHKGFIGREEDSSTCKCDIGFGKTMNECRECEDGFFSSSIDSPCRAWTKCKENRVRENGSKTSDAVCFETVDHFPPVTMTPGLKAETISLSARNMSLPPQISTPTGLPHEKVDNRRNHVIGGLIVGVIVGLLILTAVVIKCKAKEGPEYKRPIKETQQAKSHSTYV